MSSFIILSYGRSGSVLLAHNVGRNVGSLPTYANFVEELGSPVVHTHLTLPAESFAGYQRIFNLRADPVEAVLSFLIAKHYNTYHKFKDQDLPALDPFYINEQDIEDCCRGLVDWHNYYASQLTSTDMVIVYEQMVSVLTTSVYDRIYPDKHTIIQNYSEAKQICEQHLDQMLASTRIFLMHTNTQNIADYVNYSD
jgi:LPS sulfotransferase NodH